MIVGIDLGGTNIKGMAEGNNGVVETHSIPTERERGYKVVLENIVLVIKELEKRLNKKATHVGLALPGAADEFGNVINCINLGWRNLPIKKDLEEKINAKFYIENDATLATLAELEEGSLRKVKNGIMLTLGTGVGGGIVIGGKLYRGSRGLASELGHIRVGHDKLCNCGSSGCLESFASATALEKHVEELKLEKNYTSKEIFELSKKEVEPFKSAVDRYLNYLASGIIAFMNILDPEVISIGGGVANAGSYLIERLNIIVEKEKYYKDVKNPKICLAEVGYMAGARGALLFGKKAGDVYVSS